MSIITQALQQGGSVANQGMQGASQTLSGAGRTLSDAAHTVEINSNIMNSKVSLDMKVQETLLNAEATKINTSVNALKSMAAAKASLAQADNFRAQTDSTRTTTAMKVNEYNLANGDTDNLISIKFDENGKASFGKADKEHNEGLFLRASMNKDSNRMRAKAFARAVGDYNQKNYNQASLDIAFGSGDPKTINGVLNDSQKQEVNAMAIAVIKDDEELNNKLKEQALNKNPNATDKEIKKYTNERKAMILGASSFGSSLVKKGKSGNSGSLKTPGAATTFTKGKNLNAESVFESVNNADSLESMNKAKQLAFTYLNTYGKDDKTSKSLQQQITSRFYNGDKVEFQKDYDSYNVSLTARNEKNKTDQQAGYIFADMVSGKNAESYINNIVKKSNKKITKENAALAYFNSTISMVTGSNFFKKKNVAIKEKYLDYMKRSVIGANSKGLLNDRDKNILIQNLSKVKSIMTVDNKITNGSDINKKDIANMQNLTRKGMPSSIISYLDSIYVSNEDKLKILNGTLNKGSSVNVRPIEESVYKAVKTINSDSTNAITEKISDAAMSLDKLFTKIDDLNVDGNTGQEVISKLANVNIGQLTIDISKNALILWNRLNPEDKKILLSQGYNPMSSVTGLTKIASHNNNRLTDNIDTFENIKENLNYIGNDKFKNKMEPVIAKELMNWANYIKAHNNDFTRFSDYVKDNVSKELYSKLLKETDSKGAEGIKEVDNMLDNMENNFSTLLNGKTLIIKEPVKKDYAIYLNRIIGTTSLVMVNNNLNKGTKWIQQKILIL